MQDSVLKLGIDLFSATSETVTMFVLPLAVARIAYTNVTGSNQSSYFEILKGIVLYFILINSYQVILEILFSFGESFRPENLTRVQESTSEVSGLPLTISWGLETMIALLYQAARILNLGFILLLSSLAPIIFLLCCLFRIGIGTKLFFSLLVMVSSWPIVFHACSSLMNSAHKIADGKFELLVFELVISSLRLLGPVALGILAAASPAGQALSLGLGLGKSLGVNSGRFLTMSAIQVGSGARGSKFYNNRVSSNVTERLLSYSAQKLSHGLGQRFIQKPRAIYQERKLKQKESSDSLLK